MACDPQTLVTDAACLSCSIPPGMARPIMIALLAQIAGVPLDPETLVANAVPFVPLNGMSRPVIISLLCQIGGV